MCKHFREYSTLSHCPLSSYFFIFRFISVSPFITKTRNIQVLEKYQLYYFHIPVK